MALNAEKGSDGSERQNGESDGFERQWRCDDGSERQNGEVMALNVE